MLNPTNNKEIVFPLTLGALLWKGKEYVWNDVNGGACSIGSFGYLSNHFMGGRCVKLGFIAELGFYGCQDKNRPEGHQKLLGYHIEDPSKITALGKELLEKTFPQYKINYIRIEDVPLKTIDKVERQRIEQEAIKYGYEEYKVKDAHIDTLKSLIKAAKFEQQQEKESKPAPKPRKTPVKKSVADDQMVRVAAKKKAMEESA